MKQPTPADEQTARRVLLDGLAREDDVPAILAALEPLHPRDNTFPGEVLMDVGADALGWSGPSRAEPLPLADLRERFLPEVSLRGSEHRKLQYAVLATAALHGGTAPDLLGDTAWQTDDVWKYALYAAVAYIRAAAARAGTSVSAVCQELDHSAGHPAP